VRFISQPVPDGLPHKILSPPTTSLAAHLLNSPLCGAEYSLGWHNFIKIFGIFVCTFWHKAWEFRESKILRPTSHSGNEEKTKPKKLGSRRQTQNFSPKQKTAEIQISYLR
jgi:hypothetical protein